MAGKHIKVPVVIFSSLLLALLMISVVSSISADHPPLEYQTLVSTFLPTRETELETLSWETQSESEPQYSSTSHSLSLKLQHVDNLSPVSTTSESLLDTRLQRDALRTKLILAANGQFSSPVISGLPWDSGEYFTRIGLGSPPKFYYMVMDTGSDIIWLQCLPCKKCYKQVGPIFNPNKSSSFHQVPCGSKICHLLQDSSKCGKRKQCLYGTLYGDGSVTVGEFSTETLTFGKKTKVRKVAFGCGRYNKGLFSGAAGLIGLARHKLSFLGQAGNKFGNKFSYCLANRWPNSSNKSNKSSSSSSSYLIFGDSPACGKAVYTPLVKNPVRDVLNMFYYVGLEGISVCGSRVPGIKASMFDIDRKTGDGGVIVDSGTSVTRLRNETYLALRDAFRKATKHLKPAVSKYDIFDTCYHLSRMKEVNVPTVDLHFRGGAKVSLTASNCLIPVDNNGTHCFAFAGTADSDSGLSIIGNIQQQGLGMVFDLPNKRLGFAPNAC